MRTRWAGLVAVLVGPAAAGEPTPVRPEVVAEMVAARPVAVDPALADMPAFRSLTSRPTRAEFITTRLEAATAPVAPKPPPVELEVPSLPAEAPPADIDVAVECPIPVFERAIAAEARFQLRQQVAGPFGGLRVISPSPRVALAWSPRDGQQLEQYLTSGVATEVCRELLKTRTYRPYPWLIAGVPEALFADAARRARLDEVCRRQLAAGQALALPELFARGFGKTGPPEAQCYSVAAFLAAGPASQSVAAAGGPNPEGFLGRIVRADDAANAPGADAATEFAKAWGFMDAAALQAAWIAWLKTPESRPGPAPAASKRPLIPPTDVGAAASPSPSGRIPPQSLPTPNGVGGPTLPPQSVDLSR